MMVYIMLINYVYCNLKVSVEMNKILSTLRPYDQPTLDRYSLHTCWILDKGEGRDKESPDRCS